MITAKSPLLSGALRRSGQGGFLRRDDICTETWMMKSNHAYLRGKHCRNSAKTQRWMWARSIGGAKRRPVWLEQWVKKIVEETEEASSSRPRLFSPQISSLLSFMSFCQKCPNEPIIWLPLLLLFRNWSLHLFIVMEDVLQEVRTTWEVGATA